MLFTLSEGLPHKISRGREAAEGGRARAYSNYLPPRDFLPNAQFSRKVQSPTQKSKNNKNKLPRTVGGVTQARAQKTERLFETFFDSLGLE